jgi:predicted O-linked N-acetylglucosamine transferase (SPINDLY family)
VNPTGPGSAEGGAAAPPEALFARALALHQRGELAQAGNLYRQVLRAQPQHGDALHLLGVVAAQTGNPQGGAELMGRALALDPDNPAILANRGNALEDLGRVEEALAAFERAHALAPHQDFLLGMVLRVRRHLCLWQGWEEGAQALREALQAGQKAAMPFEVMSWLDEPPLHLRSSRVYVQDRFPPDTALGPLRPRAPGGRLHIGYFSSDFFDHATLHLLLEVLEQHDRSRFELTAFSYGPSRADPWRARAAAAVDRFVDLNGKSDREAAALARQLGVDIAVDLKGHTNNARPGIFAFRAAPLQVAFLGHPGTLGQALMDYAIADRTVVPDEALAHWAEKLLRLPGCYQPNMGTREIEAHPPPRAHWGLPDGAFVYASFNAHYKITPAQWAGWMRILQRAPASVLWVLAPPAAVRRELAAAAAAAGV